MAGGFIGGFNPLNEDPIEYSGKWGLKEQLQAIAAGKWTGILLPPELYVWGYNAFGNVGDITTTNKSSPVQVGTLNNWSDVAFGSSHTLSVKTDGSLFAFGRNNYGQLGLNNTTNFSSPVQVGSLTNWSQVSAAERHSAAVKTNGTLWTWGQNSVFGVLGHNNTTNLSSPVQVGALTNWSQVDSGKDHLVAIKTDGTLWAWGKNENIGQLGDGTLINRSSPVQIGALTDWYQASAGYYMTAAVKTDNTIWTWGGGAFGRLGTNSTYPNLSSPAQLGALSNWSRVSAGQDHCVAVKTDGTLWAWGRNNLGGALGDNTTITKSSPVQIGSLTDWSLVWAGQFHNAAVKTNGTLWCWGFGAVGSLGQGNTINRSSPIQVGVGTSWTKVSAGGDITGAILQEITN